MSWERRRNGRLFYYREFRRGRRVVKEYVGGGAVGEAAAREDAARREQRAAQRHEEQERRQADLMLSQHVRTVDANTDAMLETVLLVAGFHRPRRKAWRKRSSRKDQYENQESKGCPEEAEESDAASKA
ncbi:MAG TPA: hypothetical protein PLF81_18685 [Candidatus Anammoximicrobium sp.]|nr:hypothetical protein [Candidatus Anammoximicrobium sp.]